MYEITESEATTVLAVLSRAAGRENAEPDPPGVPPSTFYATRRKIYESGWLSDRYIPHPWAIGSPAIDFVLASPGPAQRARVEYEWATCPENVLLWSGVNVLFGVFFRKEGAVSPYGEGTQVSVTSDRGSIPVFFDFSRAWSRFIQVDRSAGYPRSLGEALSKGGQPSVPAISELIHEDPGVVGEAHGGRRWHTPSGATRRLQRLLEQGLVQSRTVLNLEALPPYDGRRLGEIVYLTGELREGFSSAEVLAALNNECRVSPVLMADDGTSVLIVALGQTEAASPSRTKVSRVRSPVTALLDSRLKNLRMTIERADAVRTMVNHRYDRLFPPPRHPPSVGAQ